jgi:SHS2 domain-containing protein
VYEVFEHTADVGLRIRAPDLPGLLAEAGRGLGSLIAGDLEQVREAESETIRVRGSDRAILLFDWLSEVLWAFEGRRMLFRRFEVRVDPHGAEGVGWGERFDPARHRLVHEVKAVTYHQLAVTEAASGLEATVIFDI